MVQGKFRQHSIITEHTIGRFPAKRIHVRAGAGGGKREAAEIDAGLTDQTLSCAAKAHVAKAERRAACLHLNCAMLAACRRSGTAKRGGSAAGPKPGRASFYGELGRALSNRPWLPNRMPAVVDFSEFGQVRRDAVREPHETSGQIR